MTRGITKYSCPDGTHQKAKIPPFLPPDVEKPRTEPCSNALKEALELVPRWTSFLTKKSRYTFFVHPPQWGGVVHIFNY